MSLSDVFDWFADTVGNVLLLGYALVAVGGLVVAACAVIVSVV